MVKNIIFDLAGVVLNLNIERDTEALTAAGFPPFEDFPKHPEICKPCMDYLNGLCDTETFLNNVRPFCLKTARDKDILWAMNAVLDDIPLTRLQMIAELKKHYNVYLLSNIYDYAWQYTLNEIHAKGFIVEDLFHKTFLSYEMQLAKPDPRIFQAVIEDTGINPSETLYFDDSKENINAGAAQGLISYLVPMNELESILAPLNLPTNNS